MPVGFARVFKSLTLSRAGYGVGLTSLLLLAGAGSVHDATASRETRTLSFHHTHSGEDLTVSYKRNGRYDEAALKQALAIEAAYHAFVGSQRKMTALRDKLVATGLDPAAIGRVKAPAGLDLGGITPEEIAMSILAEITVERRRGQRDTNFRPGS